MKLSEIYKTKKFIITAEIFPPKGTNIQSLREKSKILKNYVDAINVTDNQRACLRLGGLAIAKLLIDEGLIPIYQLTCRDRNRLALQSDLLAASVFGVQNILILSGDHPKHGDHPETKPVFDFDSVQLLKVAKNLNTGYDFAGNKLNGATDFYIGAVVNPTIEPLDLQIIPMKKKIEAGAKYFQTQVSFDIEIFKKFYQRLISEGIRDKVKIIAGVFLLKSAKMIEFMKKIPGVYIPDNIVERISKADNQLDEGIKISAELIRELKTIFDGAHIMAINSEELIPNILEKI
ncbi:MAG TPA: methylenetetrahydrofolate reductase [bacterium]|nr:methylenetetrahydrofolate reductase [bacterium]